MKEEKIKYRISKGVLAFIFILNFDSIFLLAEDNPKIEADLKWRLSFNSDYPNFFIPDGAAWQGKGFNGHFQPRLSLDGVWYNAAFSPEFWIAQNLVYDYRSYSSAFGDYWVDLDRLQRYGTEYWWEFSWGDSAVSLRNWGMELKVGTARRSIGPAVAQNLLISNQAAGFPRLDIGTDGEISTFLGDFNAYTFWGQTSQSPFYDSVETNDKRLLTGVVASYSFPFIRDMEFGFARLFHSPWKTINAWKVFQFITDTVWKDNRGEFAGGPGFEDDVDQVLSLFLDWNMPEHGSRIYGEIARNDHAGNMIDFLMQPDHSLGWTLGFYKEFQVGGIEGFSISGEFSDAGINMGTVVRPTGSWYRHFATVGGWTHNGQLLGAPMGPGSNFQGFYLSQKTGGYRAMAGVERLNFDTDYFYATANWSEQPYYKYNLSMNWLGSVTWIGENMEIGLEVKYTQNWNHNFNYGDFRPNFYAAVNQSIKY